MAVPNPCLRALRAIALALAVGGAAPPRAVAAPATPDTSFWARYQALSELFDADPAAATARVHERLRADSLDVLAHWAIATRMPDADSAAAAALAARFDPSGTGGAFERACRIVGRAPADGWAALDRARDGWIGRGRAGSAAQAVMLLALRDSDPRGVQRRAARFAEAESLATVAHAPLDAAAARLRAAQALSMRAGEAALPELRRILADVDSGPPSVVRADAHLQLGGALKTLGRLDEAEPHYAAARDLARASDAEGLSLRAGMGLANLRKARGDVRDALVEQRRVLERAREVGNRLMQLLALADIGNTELALGHLDAAREATLEGLAIQQRRGGTWDTRIALLDQLGGVEALSGRPDSAARRFDEALTLARARGSRGREAYVLQHLAQFELDQGHPEEARRWNDLALAAARETGQRRAEQIAITQAARILGELGQLDGAADMALTGVRMTREAEPRSYPTAVQLAARVLLRADRAPAAAALLDSLRVFLRAHPDSLGEADADRLDATLRLRAGDGAGAVAALQRAIAVFEALDARDAAASARLALGETWLQAGSATEAIAPLESAMTFLENLVAATAAEDDRAGTASHWQDGYVDLATAYVRAGDVARAFALMDRSRARELRASFGARRAPAGAGAPPDLARELAAVEEDLAEVQANMFAQYVLPVRARDRRLHAWERRADSLRVRWTEARRRLQRTAPGVAAVAGLGDPLRAADAQARLLPGERLLAFFTGDEHALVFDVTRDGIAAHELPWANAALDREVEAWRGALATGRGDAWRAGAARLADSLLGACALPAAGDRRVYVIPDGALHRVPFEALLVPGAGGRRTLLERGEVVYASSPSALLSGGDGAGEPRLTGASLAAFGDPRAGEGAARSRGASADSADTRATALELRPLPNARREVQALHALFPGARTYVGPAASEQRFRAELGRARALHVAAHGFADDRHPEFSGLVLAPDRREDDGLVQAWELLDQRGRLDLVTLSACETGRGKLLRGEGLLGLSRAFAIAGARQLVVTLWKVDDAATADLMVDFYTRLRAGRSAAAALREARLAMLRGGDAPTGDRGRGVSVTTESSARSHPSVWAPFVLQATRLR